MPKYVSCPTCQIDVKVPRDAEPGDELTCPECHEVFVPPHLKKKNYSVEEEEGYDVGKVQEDRDRAKKKRKAKAIMEQGRQTNRERSRSGPRPFFGGLEIALLVFAGVATLAFGLGYIIAKRFPTTGEAALIIVGYCGLLLMFGWRKLIGGRQRLGG